MQCIQGRPAWRSIPVPQSTICRGVIDMWAVPSCSDAAEDWGVVRCTESLLGYHLYHIVYIRAVNNERMHLNQRLLCTSLLVNLASM